VTAPKFVKKNNHEIYFTVSLRFWGGFKFYEE
jgi:hypothetical protein